MTEKDNPITIGKVTTVTLPDVELSPEDEQRILAFAETLRHIPFFHVKARVGAVHPRGSQPGD